MGDNLWFGFVLGLKWGILKFSDFIKIELFFRNKEKNFPSKD